MKAQGIINRPAIALFKVIGNDAYRKIYDATFDEGKLLEKVAD